jgi:hypothetical protein
MGSPRTNSHRRRTATIEIAQVLKWITAPRFTPSGADPKHANMGDATVLMASRS